MDLSQIDFDTWMEWGLQRKFVSPPVCWIHDGMPMTAEEEQLLGEGDDICIHVIRPYRSTEEREAIEENHAPTNWRNPFRTATNNDSV